MYKKQNTLPLKDIKINSRFWNRYVNLIREEVLPYQWEALNDRIPEAAKSGCLENFKVAAGKSDKEHYGMVFQDSDLYKWLESAAYSIETHPDPGLETLADEVIDIIADAQLPSGYINTYYQTHHEVEPWSNLQHGHELYCAGHLIEAGVAYLNATGKLNLYEVAVRFALHIYFKFGKEDDKIHGYPGHQIIELALFKLYKAGQDARFRKLMEYFLSERGKAPNYFDEEEKRDGYRPVFPQLAELNREYSQSHIPPAEQKEAVGHAVRALYMYCGMADLASIDENEEMLSVCETLFDDIMGKKAYITGAVGQTAAGEAFAGAYDLPPDTIYGETCAAVGLIMFARRMCSITADGRYARVVEHALYNSVISGISLTGKEFFYVNPLEVEPERIRKSPELRHVKPVRQKWFDCSCCPTNLSRTVMNLGEYIYGESELGIYVNMYVAGEMVSRKRSLSVETDYPYVGTAKITARGGRYVLSLRNPASAPITSLSINGKAQKVFMTKEYVELKADWNGDVIEIAFDMKPRLVYASPKVSAAAGQAAVMRGPVVYCVEEIDNGKYLSSIILPYDASFRELPAPEGLPEGTIALETDAFRRADKQNSLYTYETPEYESVKIMLVPYHLWANRGENEMRVYMQAEPRLPKS